MAFVAPHVRTVKTSSGATAVQIVYSNRRGSREIEHIGSAHSDAEVQVLKTVARDRLRAGQGELELEFDQLGGAGGSPVSLGSLPIRSSRMAVLGDALAGVYALLGFDAAAGGDEVFRALVLARIIEPTSKLDSLRVLSEAGLACSSYRTIKRRLPIYATEDFRQRLSGACADRAGLGPASLVLYDVSTLYFETDHGDGFREPGFSKERRLEPQITIGLLTDHTGFPLMLNAFEGNKGETLTMIPTIRSFMTAHDLPDVIVVADAGMVSAANQQGIEDAGLSFIIGMRILQEPYLVGAWRAAHPGQDIPDGQVFIQPWPAGPGEQRRDHMRYYRYRGDYARRTLKNIDEQISKAEKTIAGQAAIKRNRFVRLSGGSKSVNRALEAKARSVAGIKGYVTNLDPVVADADFVIGAYHQLFQIEKSFRMSKHDLAARPIYHHKRDSIEAHLSIVFAALAISRYVEAETGWSIRRFVRTARRYRTIEIAVGNHTITAADPLPDDLANALKQLNSQGGPAH